jgi:hypothetical protein
MTIQIHVYPSAPENFVVNFYTHTRLGGVYAKCTDGRFRKVVMAGERGFDGSFLFAVPAVRIAGELSRIQVNDGVVYDLLESH